MDKLERIREVLVACGNSGSEWRVRSRDAILKIDAILNEPVEKRSWFKDCSCRLGNYSEEVIKTNPNCPLHSCTCIKNGWSRSCLIHGICECDEDKECRQHGAVEECSCGYYFDAAKEVREDDLDCPVHGAGKNKTPIARPISQDIRGKV